MVSVPLLEIAPPLPDPAFPILMFKPERERVMGVGESVEEHEDRGADRLLLGEGDVSEPLQAGRADRSGGAESMRAAQKRYLRKRFTMCTV